MPCGDTVNIHDYHVDPEVLVERYGSRAQVAYTLEHVRPARRRLVIDGFTGTELPLFLSEFGGIACMEGRDTKGWGYSVARDGNELLERYRALMAAIHRCKPLSGFCYTQLTDTFLEKNGLLTEYRVPKAPIEALAQATRGPEAMLHDWYVDPLGHSEQWRGKRGTNVPIEWVGGGADARPHRAERPGSPGPDDTPGHEGSVATPPSRELLK
jgi:hypothetical protein